MGPTPGNCQYSTFMGAYDDIDRVDRKTLDYIGKHFPKFLEAPAKWEEPSLSSLELFSKTQTPASVAAGAPVPRAPDAELPGWWKAMQGKKPRWTPLPLTRRRRLRVKGEVSQNATFTAS